MTPGSTKFYALRIGTGEGPVYEVIEVEIESVNVQARGTDGRRSPLNCGIQLIGETPADALKKMRDYESAQMRHDEHDLADRRRALIVLEEQYKQARSSE